MMRVDELSRTAGFGVLSSIKRGAQWNSFTLSVLFIKAEESHVCASVSVEPGSEKHMLHLKHGAI